jgi:hypothetical protein
LATFFLQVLLNHAQPEWAFPPAPDSSEAAPTASKLPARSSSWLPRSPGPSRPIEAKALLRDGKETSSADESAMGAAAAAAGMQQPEPAVAAAGTAREACEAVTVNAGIQVQLNSIVDAYGDWYVQQVVRDVKGQGVLYAPQLRAFTAVAGQADVIQSRACLQELAALVKVRCSSAGRGALDDATACQQPQARNLWAAGRQLHGKVQRSAPIENAVSVCRLL